MRRTSFALFVSLLLGFAAFRPAGAQYTGVSSLSTPGLNIRQPLTTDRAILFPPQRDALILPGDLLTINVFGVTPSYIDVERVAIDGTIGLAMAGKIAVGGYTQQAAETRISSFFEEQQIFHDAAVSIQLTESPGHQVTLVGALKKNVPVVAERRLLDVLAEAGGLPPTASTVIKIDRPGQAEPIYVDLGNDPATSIAANVPIFTGDLITTGDVGHIFIVGAVTTPGVHPLEGSRPITVLQAISLAGGTTFVAKRDETRLIRTVGSTRSVINLHLKEIQRGEEPDPVLQADDILLVPTSAIKAALRLNNATSAVSIALGLTAILR